MQQTIGKVIEASQLPISIIIVGIGDEDFTQMIELDSDEVILSQVVNGEKIEAKRDIVQFVPFKDFKHDPKKLAKETLQEIPEQFLDYMDFKNIKPKKDQGNKAAYIQMKKEITKKQEELKEDKRSLTRVPMTDEDMPEFLLSEKLNFKAALKALRYSDIEI